jgi:aerobic carbon-monoxide dehydrogenase medium subunit
MYPASFAYSAPVTLDEALSILDQRGDEAKVLAGGQSLIPLMKLRFAAPGLLVDINRIPGLDGLEERDGFLRIGPLVRHRACERSELLRRRYGVLAETAPQISDPIVRNLGTVAGSLAHADPQGDWGSALLAAGAEVEARSLAGTRTIPLSGFFSGPFETVLEPNEVVTSVRVPAPSGRSGGAYLKLERKVGDFATVGVAVQLTFDDGKVERAGIALTAVAPANVTAPAAERALVGRELTAEAVAEAARLAADAAEPRSDLRGSADYKRRVVQVFTERGLRRAAAAAGVTVGGQAATGPEPAPMVAGVPRVTPEVARPPAEGEETFSGRETVAGVMDELRRKEGGPE